MVIGANAMCLMTCSSSCFDSLTYCYTFVSWLPLELLANRRHFRRWNKRRAPPSTLSPTVTTHYWDCSKWCLWNQSLYEVVIFVIISFCPRISENDVYSNHTALGTYVSMITLIFSLNFKCVCPTCLQSLMLNPTRYNKLGKYLSNQNTLIISKTVTY